MEKEHKKLLALIEEVSQLKNDAPWGGAYKVWRKQLEKEIEMHFGREGLELIDAQKGVALDDEAFGYELDQTYTIVQRMIANKDDFSSKNTAPPHLPQAVSISNSQVHFGVGDNAGPLVVNDRIQDIPLWLKWVATFVTISGIGGAAIWSQFVGDVSFLSSTPPIIADTIATSTPNLENILEKNNTFSTSLEKQNFVSKYKDLVVYGAGTFEDIDQSGGGDYLVFITVARNRIGCSFGPEWERDLLTFTKGNQVTFTGVFTGSGLAGYGAINPWLITDCGLLR